MRKRTLLVALMTILCYLVKGEPVNHLTLDGINQYVSIPTTDDLKMTSEESLTVSYWVKSESNVSSRIISNRDNMTSSNGSLDYYFGGIMFVSTDGDYPITLDLSDYNGTTTFKWYHYVTVYNRADSTVTVYQDGDYIYSNKNLRPTDVINSTINTSFGAGNNGATEHDKYLHGNIANVRFYKSALTAEEASIDMQTNSYNELTDELKEHCVAAYDLTDNYTSLEIIDATGNGNNGELINYIDHTFKPTEYLSFNGTDQYVSIPTTDYLRMTSEESLTVSYWVKPISNSNERIISNRYKMGNTAGALDYYYGGFMLISSDGSFPLGHDINMTANTWMHFVTVFDRESGSIMVYKDGTMVISNNYLQDTDIINTTSNTFLGAATTTSNSMSYFLEGAIANVRFYKSALTSDEIGVDMKAGNYNALEDNLKDKCVAAYDLTDNYSSLTLTDATGNGNNGELINYEEPIPLRTITVSAQPLEWGVVSGGATSNKEITITATANDGYQFSHWSVNGIVVSTESTYTDDTEGDKEYVANFTIEYCQTTETNDATMKRYLNSLTFENEYGTQTLDVSQLAGDPVYCNKTSKTITLIEGESTSVTADWNGTLLHGYLYIDLNKDGVFTPKLGVLGAVSSDSELLSYTYYQGFNSKSESVANSGGLSNIPAFKTSVSATEGIYSARFVIDWNSLDPCGSVGIGAKGGTVVDFTVDLILGDYIGERTIKSESNNHNMGYTTGNETSAYAIELSATAYDGYTFVNWTLDGVEFSTSSTIIDHTEGDKTYIANFEVDTTSRPSNYLSFNGIDQYVDIPSYSETEMNEGESLSISFWVRALNTNGKFPRVLCNRDFENTKYDGALDVYYDNLGCGAMFIADSLDVKTYVLGGYIGGEPGKWTHIAFVFDRDEALAKTYVNGTLSITGVLDATDVLRSDMNTILGARWSANDTLGLFLEGDIANLRYYGSALTTEQITEDMETNAYSNLSESLKDICNVAYDLENLYSDSNLIDETGNGNNATLVNYILPSDLTIQTDEAETTNKRYKKVTVKTAEGSPTNWTIGTHTIYSNSLNIEVCKDGTTPEVEIVGDGVLITDTTTITHTITGGEWKIISLPFDINLADIVVDGEAPVYGTNVVVQVYDAAKRANSYEGWTVSGWVSKSEGTISANQGFAIGIDAEVGETKDVVFTSYNARTYTNDDEAVTLNLNPSSVNKGMDGDWNFIGTPLLASSIKGDGYSLYIYNGATNAYTEYSSSERAPITPHGGMFIQGADDFQSITFSAGLTVDRSLNTIDGEIKLTINGNEDEAKMLVKYGTSEEFVKNEDAMYFSPLSNKVAQIYYVDQNGDKIASSEVPTIAESTNITYTAVTSGTQSIAMTTDITNTALYLQDNTTGESTLMTDGTIYEFESATGTFTNRFTLVAEGEVTGVESAISSNLKVVVGDNKLTILDAEVGAKVAIFSINGTQLYSGVIKSTKEEIAISTTGVVVVKVNNEAIKAVL